MATERIISIEGKDVTFKASAALPLVYRRLFQSDIYKDLQTLFTSIKKSSQEGKENLDLSALQILSNIAYSMACHANKNIPDMEEWLEEFNMFSLQASALEIIELWQMNNLNLEKAKKNNVAPIGK